MAPHSPCQCHEKSDRRSETDPRSRQCHRDEIPGKATNSEKQKKRERKEGEGKTIKAKANQPNPSAWPAATPKKEKPSNYVPTTKNHEKGAAKRNRKPKQIVEKDNSKTTKVVRRMTIGWTMTDSRTKLKEVKSNPMDYDRRTPHETLTRSGNPC